MTQYAQILQSARNGSVSRVTDHETVCGGKFCANRKSLKTVTKKTIKEAILVIINCLIVVSSYTISSEWIVITNARVLHNAMIKFYNDEMYTCLTLCLTANGLL